MRPCGDLAPPLRSSPRCNSEKPFYLLKIPLLKLFPSICVLVVCLIGCGEKPIDKHEIRGITGEIVAAAEKTTQRKSEIAIRPEVQPSEAGAAHPSVDDIYVTLRDTSQADALKQALDAIARRHKLFISETNSNSVMRLDFSFKGVRTHTVHVVTSMITRPSAPALQGGSESGPKLAIILDDMGYDRAAADAALTLSFPITLSVIPHLPLSAEVAEEAYRRGDQVLLHLPMEAEADQAKAEPIELRVGMKADQVERDLDGMLETVPHAAGVNNHQGSRATADSRTTAATVAHDTAEKAGVRSASRKVFLDDIPRRDAILAQLDLAARDAAHDGFAIAIGHPHPETIAALVEAAPRLEARGVRFVFVSDVVR